MSNTFVVGYGGGSPVAVAIPPTIESEIASFLASLKDRRAKAIATRDNAQAIVDVAQTELAQVEAMIDAIELLPAKKVAP